MNFAEEAKRIIAECDRRIADGWADGKLFFENGVPLRIMAHDPAEQGTADMLTKLLNRTGNKEAS